MVRKNEKVEHKWTFEGHQLGVVSVTTDPNGEGLSGIVLCIGIIII